jgi:hypothetical protein
MTVGDDVPRALRTSPAALRRLDITICLVTAEGAVEIWEREN